MANNPVIDTLLYESIFSSSFNKKNLWKFLISEKKISKEKFEGFIADSRILYNNKTHEFYLKNKKVSDKKRNSKKIEKAVKAAHILSFIPSINFIGISGSLALDKASESDDIDFFIISKENTIWTTRFFAVISMKALGLYRDSRNFQDKICLNMFVSKLSFPVER